MTATVVRLSVCRLVGRIAVATLLAVLAASVALLIVIPRIVHGGALTVLTGSMAPGMPAGSVVVVRPVDPRALHVGDVATYRLDGAEPVTHRIVAIDESTTPALFTFRGDANRAPDPQPVPATAIRGKVLFDVPYVGSLRARLARYRTWLIAAGVLCLGGYSMWQFAAAWREREGHR